MSFYHSMYICNRCGWGHYHPLSYCQKCPGKLVKTKVLHPDHFTEKELIKYLQKQGIIYEGEYIQVDPIEKLKINLERCKEKLLNSQLNCCMVSHRDGYYPERSVEFWKREISKIEEELNNYK